VSRKDTAIQFAKTAAHHAAVERSRRIIRLAVEGCSSWYVAFSAGKDSTCVLHLVRSFLPDAPAVTSVRQWDLPETEALMARTSNLHTVSYDGYNGVDWAVRWLDRAHAESRHPGLAWLDTKDEIMARGRNERGVFLGLRSDEARYRKLHLATMGTLFDCRKTGKYHCNPIAHWTVWDVWAYLHSRGVDYNAAYDTMEQCGIPIAAQRIGPFDHALGGGALAILKRCWPERFNRIAAAHPEARAYV